MYCFVYAASSLKDASISSDGPVSLPLMSSEAFRRCVAL